MHRPFIRIIVFLVGEKRLIRYLSERSDSAFSEIRRNTGAICSALKIRYIQGKEPEEEIRDNLYRILCKVLPERESGDEELVPPYDTASLRNILHNAPESCYRNTRGKKA